MDRLQLCLIILVLNLPRGIYISAFKIRLAAKFQSLESAGHGYRGSRHHFTNDKWKKPWTEPGYSTFTTYVGKNRTGNMKNDEEKEVDVLTEQALKL